MLQIPLENTDLLSIASAGAVTEQSEGAKLLSANEESSVVGGITKSIMPMQRICVTSTTTNKPSKKGDQRFIFLVGRTAGGATRRLGSGEQTNKGNT